MDLECYLIREGVEPEKVKELIKRKSGFEKSLEGEQTWPPKLVRLNNNDTNETKKP